MTSASIYLVAGIALFVLGGVYLALHHQIIGKILALNVAGSGVFLVLVTIADGSGGGAPDPVPHALVLTGIVVAISATAVALAFVSRMQANSSTDQNSTKK